MNARVESRWAAIAAFAWLAVAAWTVFAFLPLIHGFFLSDDFVLFVLFEQWRNEGRFGTTLASKFWSGLDAGGNRFYRPLTFLTFALQEWASGIEPRGWMWVTVGLHVANGLLVAAVALKSSGEQADSRSWAAAAVGCALFLSFAPGVEVAAWISGRFDALATLFSLLAVLGFLGSRRAFDAAWWGSLAAMAAACMSKESAAVIPFAVLLYARFVRLGATPGVRGWTAAVRLASPWLLLAIAYLTFRWAIFGSATGVYENATPLGELLAGAKLREIAASLPKYMSAQFPIAHGFAMVAALSLLQLAVIAMARPPEPRVRGAVYAALGSSLMAFLLLLPSAYFPAHGIGGRLLYQAAAFYAVFSAVALRQAAFSRLLVVVTFALVVLHAVIEERVLRRWHYAYGQMSALVSGIRDLERELEPAGFALVLVPQSLRHVPFAGNAQAGLMHPPFLGADTSRHLLVQIHDEIPEFAGKLREGVIPTLRRFSVSEYIAGKRATSDKIVYPSRVMCWDSGTSSLARLRTDAFSAANAEAWVRDMQAALRSSPCRGD